MTMTEVEYRIDPVWPSASEEIQQRVRQFWRTEGALTDEARAKKRSQELIVVAWTHDQEVAAVSTARRVQVNQLGLGAFFYRMYVGRRHRTRGLRSTDLVRRILLSSYQILNERYRQGHHRDCAGLYMEIENPSVKRHRNETVWTDLGANVVFLGKTPRENHARIWYFDGSRV